MMQIVCQYAGHCLSMSVKLFVHILVKLPVKLSVIACQIVYQYVCQIVSMCLSNFLSIRLSNCLSTYLSNCLSSICLSNCPSCCLFVYSLLFVKVSFSQFVANFVRLLFSDLFHNRWLYVVFVVRLQ